MSVPVLSKPAGNLGTELPGIWWLLSREDWTPGGQRRTDPVLGADPLGIVSYAKDHFAAQFMKRDRKGAGELPAFAAGANNTSAQNGYDAYFGTYRVDENSGRVAHTLLGSITAANIGMTVHRDLRVKDNTLIIQLETTSPEGEPLIRTLTWKRIN